MNLKKIMAIFQKQVADTLKNKAVFIQFVMFPIMTIIINDAIKVDGMPENFFVTLFASMYIAMAPITSMSAIISEEKEKNTLRVLMMSNVKPAEYLIGVGVYIWFICMLGSIVFGLIGKYRGWDMIQFLIIMSIGIVISTLLGAVLGIWSKNQMMSTSITVPVMMVFSFLPMFSVFNETIRKISKFAYSQQINMLMDKIGEVQIKSENVIIIIINITVMISLFIHAYKRSGLA